jgi:hypothetical protein
VVFAETEAGEQRLERCDLGGDDLDRKELVAQSFGDGGIEYAPRLYEQHTNSPRCRRWHRHQKNGYSSA